MLALRDYADVRSPQSFFKNVLLLEKDAVFWLETRLSVMRKIDYLYTKLRSNPHIWMLTGLELLEDATHIDVQGRTSENSAAAAVPVPEPTGFAALAGISIGGQIHYGSGNTMTAGRKVKGSNI